MLIELNKQYQMLFENCDSNILESTAVNMECQSSNAFIHVNWSDCRLISYSYVWFGQIFTQDKSKLHLNLAYNVVCLPRARANLVDFAGLFFRPERGQSMTCVWLTWFFFVSQSSLDRNSLYLIPSFGNGIPLNLPFFSGQLITIKKTIALLECAGPMLCEKQPIFAYLIISQHFGCFFPRYEKYETFCHEVDKANFDPLKWFGNLKKWNQEILVLYSTF